MTASLIVLGVVAALIVAAVTLTAKAAHEAPVMEDEPSQLDRWDNPKGTDQ